ncbi:serine palmitoyltransferase component, variant 5 [Lathyrus oleraceus]|uniref:Serine palmitoyltransferase component, variant 5 n=1 Tax=Pisum sativum TaxID=3888 RepID=A0A9D4VLG9_PEA|nr:serine palmitoyltransferase component, variant 5 [Pisum sativum]
MFSAIPAFSKKGDIIVADEGVHWGIQNGLYLSRSTVVYFKHNDMDSLSKTLENITSKYKGTKNLRRYIVVEALYQVDLVFHLCFFVSFTYLYHVSNEHL